MLDLLSAGTLLVAGPAGPMELIVDPAVGVRHGVVIVAHPQPLLGGSATHKVPQVLARGLAQSGWTALRPNFRGVGQSAGQHDEGRGERDDLLALCQLVRMTPGSGRLALVGFSFGAYVQAGVARALADAGAPAWRVGLAGMPSGLAGGRRYDTPDGIPNALVVHGERDERVGLDAVLAWARPQTQPVVVVPGADHFFTGRLPTLRSLVIAHLTG